MLIGFNVNNREKQFMGANLINKMEKGVSYSQKCILIFTKNEV